MFHGGKTGIVDTLFHARVRPLDQLLDRHPDVVDGEFLVGRVVRVNPPEILRRLVRSQILLRERVNEHRPVAVATLLLRRQSCVARSHRLQQQVLELIKEIHCPDFRIQ